MQPILLILPVQATTKHPLTSVTTNQRPPCPDFIPLMITMIYLIYFKRLPTLYASLLFKNEFGNSELCIEAELKVPFSSEQSTILDKPPANYPALPSPSNPPQSKSLTTPLIRLALSSSLSATTSNYPENSK